jgi:hypothetical protein
MPFFYMHKFMPDNLFQFFCCMQVTVYEHGITKKKGMIDSFTVKIDR